MKQETWREEQQRITGIIKTLQRVVGKTNRELESALGVQFGYLSRQVLDAPGLPRRLPMDREELQGMIEELIERLHLEAGDDAARERGQ